MLAVPYPTVDDMQRSIKYLCLIAALVAVAGATAPAAETQSSAQAAAKLAQIRGRIAQLTDRLGGELKQRDEASARLREAELAVTAKRRHLDGLRGAQAAAVRRRTQLQADQARAQSALDTERKVLAAQFRAAYMMGRQERIKLLLNQSDPASAGRMAIYYGYFARERAQKIGEIDARALRVRELLAETQRMAQTLFSLQVDAARDMTGLQSARAERAAALGALDRQVTDGKQELSRLKSEEQAEEALVAELAQVLEDFPIDAQQGFEALRGKLPWPVQGKVASRYRETRLDAASSMRPNGVLIEAAYGAKVRAPYFGRVIYADWLQGLGLLLIIGHKGNFMTLYGHAEVLYKSVGDWVAPGDLIAGLSDSGQAAPHLYFEIRDGRKALDPRTWLKATP